MSSKSKKWAILIYFAGDNNLSEECVYALKEMQAVGTADYDVIVQFDPAGRGNPTRRFRFRGETAKTDLELLELIAKRQDETDTGARRTLLNFLTESVKEYPADYYLVVLSGHGGGTDEDYFLRDDNRPQSLIPRSLSLPDFKKVFSDDALRDALKGGKINILGLDACVMSMVEVCYELRDGTVDLVAGSEGSTLNAGWPYGVLLSFLNKNPSIEPETLAMKLPDLYANAYKDYYIGGMSVDLSVLRVSRVRALKAEITKLAAAMSKELPKSESKQFGLSSPFQRAIVQAHWLAQSYNGEQCIDLYDFCQCLVECCDLEHIAPRLVMEACKSVQEAITDHRDSIVLKSNLEGPDFQYSYGVSIYFPWSEIDIAQHYKGLDFVAGQYDAERENKDEDKGWYNFLLRYVQATQRAPRKDIRLTPPYNRGPERVAVHSMRNPPRALKDKQLRTKK